MEPTSSTPGSSRPAGRWPLPRRRGAAPVESFTYAVATPELCVLHVRSAPGASLGTLRLDTGDGAGGLALHPAPSEEDGENGHGETATFLVPASALERGSF